MIRVVDARMGRGKTTAAEQYMAAHSADNRFMYITPYLSEVGRICESCSFEQPDSDNHAKLTELKIMLRDGKNVSSTHALFYLLDEESLNIIKEMKYSLIIDEAIEPIKKVPITSKDLAILVANFLTINEDGFAVWNDKEYSGKFDGYKDMAESGCLIIQDEALLSVMNPRVLTAFEDVMMMTYLFDGQCQKAYLEFNGMDYVMCGIDTENGFVFTDGPDTPPPFDYKSLITVVEDEKMNRIGSGRYAMSKNWYTRRPSNNDDITELKKNMRGFFRKYGASADKQLWTCFKSDMNKMIGSGGRFSSSYVQPTARATNEYRKTNTVAYLVNRFMDPNINKYFETKGIHIDEDKFALGEMLQFIWRSSIRDGKHITVYVPSSRMRSLLKQWIEENSSGGD